MESGRVARVGGAIIEHHQELALYSIVTEREARKGTYSRRRQLIRSLLVQSFSIACLPYLYESPPCSRILNRSCGTSDLPAKSLSARHLRTVSRCIAIAAIQHRQASTSRVVAGSLRQVIPAAISFTRTETHPYGEHEGAFAITSCSTFSVLPFRRQS